MTSAQDKSPDRPEGAPEAAEGDPKPLLDESGFSSGVSVRRRDALETTKKLEAAEAKVEEWRAMSEGYRLDKEEAEAEVARLLRRYGSHDVNCRLISLGQRCDCGLSQALAQQENSNG